MNTQWALETAGDPLGSVQSFLHTLWGETGLDGMLVPNNGSPGAMIGPHLIEDASELGKVNPFKPLMTMNTARLIPELDTRPSSRSLWRLATPLRDARFNRDG